MPNLFQHSITQGNSIGVCLAFSDVNLLHSVNLARGVLKQVQHDIISDVLRLHHKLFQTIFTLSH